MQRGPGDKKLERVLVVKNKGGGSAHFTTPLLFVEDVLCVGKSSPLPQTHN